MCLWRISSSHRIKIVTFHDFISTLCNHTHVTTVENDQTRVSDTISSACISYNCLWFIIVYTAANIIPPFVTPTTDPSIDEGIHSSLIHIQIALYLRGSLKAWNECIIITTAAAELLLDTFVKCVQSKHLKFLFYCNLQQHQHQEDKSYFLTAHHFKSREEVSYF